MHPAIYLPPQLIQYADNTIIIAESHPTTLKVLSLVLSIYESLTGLCINRAKSAFVPIALPPNAIPIIEYIFQSPASTLPIKYLGLPLSVRKPKKVFYLPLIAAVEGRVATWKSRLLSFGGRVTLI